jgi:hypothetical protein
MAASTFASRFTSKIGENVRLSECSSDSLCRTRWENKLTLETPMRSSVVRPPPFGYDSINLISSLAFGDLDLLGIRPYAVQTHRDL